MPWTCCGAEQKDDAQKCPSCGKAKNKWTMRLGRTRVFSLRKPLVDEEWDLEALDFTGGSSFGSVSVEGDGPAESTREEEDEDWELESLEALPGDADDEVGGGPAPAPPSESTKEGEEDEDWELESLDALPADADDEVAGGPSGGPAAESTKEGEEEDEDWELEALDALPADADEEVRGGGGGAPALAGVSSRGEDAGPGATSEADADAGTD